MGEILKKKNKKKNKKQRHLNGFSKFSRIPASDHSAEKIDLHLIYFTEDEKRGYH